MHSIFAKMRSSSVVRLASGTAGSVYLAPLARFRRRCALRSKSDLKGATGLGHMLSPKRRCILGVCVQFSAVVLHIIHNDTRLSPRSKPASTTHSAGDFRILAYMLQQVREWCPKLWVHAVRGGAVSSLIFLRLVFVRSGTSTGSVPSLTLKRVGAAAESALFDICGTIHTGKHTCFVPTKLRGCKLLAGFRYACIF